MRGVEQSAPLIRIKVKILNSCPICGKTSQFLSSRRKDEICRLCGSSERHRLVWIFLQTKNISSLKDFLHIAPEECIEKQLKHAMPGYVSIDKSSKRAMFNMDITNIQFKDESFDAVYCSHVLEHIVDDMVAMTEMRRVLRKNGWAIINVPVSSRKVTLEDNMVVDPLEREMLFGQTDHVRIYGKDFKDRLWNSGFNVEEIKWNKFLTVSERRKFGITKYAGSIFFCRKALL